MRKRGKEKPTKLLYLVSFFLFLQTLRPLSSVLLRQLRSLLVAGAKPSQAEQQQKGQGGAGRGGGLVCLSQFATNSNGGHLATIRMCAKIIIIDPKKKKSCANLLSPKAKLFTSSQQIPCNQGTRQLKFARKLHKTCILVYVKASVFWTLGVAVSNINILRLHMIQRNLYAKFGISSFYASRDLRIHTDKNGLNDSISDAEQ